MNIPVTPATIEAAYARILPHIRVTPALELPAGALGISGPLSLKLELTQHAGSFKSRGAFNTLTSLAPPAAGVAAASGGNHGAAVAHAAGRLGVKARIFVPEISSPAKVGKIRDAGAEVVQQGARYADALALCEAYQRESGAMGIHAYDAWPTIEGQGTTASSGNVRRPASIPSSSPPAAAASSPESRCGSSAASRSWPWSLQARRRCTARSPPGDL